MMKDDRWNYYWLSTHVGVEWEWVGPPDDAFPPKTDHNLNTVSNSHDEPVSIKNGVHCSLLYEAYTNCNLQKDEVDEAVQWLIDEVGLTKDEAQTLAAEWLDDEDDD